MLFSNMSKWCAQLRRGFFSPRISVKVRVYLCLSAFPGKAVCADKDLEIKTSHPNQMTLLELQISSHALGIEIACYLKLCHIKGILFRLILRIETIGSFPCQNRLWNIRRQFSHLSSKNGLYESSKDRRCDSIYQQSMKMGIVQLKQLPQASDHLDEMPFGTLTLVILLDNSKHKLFYLNWKHSRYERDPLLWV